MGVIYPAVFDAWDDTLVLVPVKHVIDGKNLTELAGLPTVYPRTVYTAARKVLLYLSLLHVLNKKCSSNCIQKADPRPEG